MGTTWCYIVNMRGLSLACVILCVGLVFGQDSTESSPEDNVTTSSPATSTTEAPVVIVKQVNEINEDGSYTVGYEASDGSFRLETKDAEGNVEGKYGVVDENGEIKIVEYSANNSTGFQSDLQVPVPETPEGGAPVQQADPAFELEKQRHAAVLAFQKAVIEKQQLIAQKNDASAQRQAFANNRQGPRRPVFNAANFDPNRPASQQFNTQNFNQDFRDFQQRQQFAQQQPQQFAQQQPSQFSTQFNQNQQFAQNPQQFAPQQPQPAQQFVPRQQQQFAPQQQQQFAPQQQFAQQPQQFAQQPQQFAQQPQQFAPQQQQQFAPQQPQQTPLSELTREQIALQGFSRDDDQDGQIDPLPAHLQPQQQPAFQPAQPQQQFFQPQQQQPQQQQFFQQQQPAFQQQPQQSSFRTPQPVQPSPVSQQQFSQAQLQQLFAQQQQQQQQF